MIEKQLSPDDQKEQQEYQKKTDLAYDKWHDNGRYGVTADDHRFIGGSPPFELAKNPGKTQGELWTIEQLKEELESLDLYLKDNREKYAADINDYVQRGLVEDNINYAKKELRLAIPYLKSINKLPQEFENYIVEDLPQDPGEKL